MKIFIVACALLINILVYWRFSVKVKSWLNILTPQYLLVIPTIYVAEIFNLWHFDPTGSDFGYLIVYLAYVLPMVTFAAAYMYMAPVQLMMKPSSAIKSSLAFPIIVMAAAVVLYLPVLRLFASDLFNPRAIYTATRTGFGVSYFGSIALCYIALILVLFNQALGRAVKTVAVVIALFFAFLHGSKGQMLTVLFIVMLYASALNAVRVRFSRFLLLASIFGVVGAAVFYSMTVGVELGDLLFLMAGYSDYSRNAVMLIDADQSLRFGAVFMEDNIFSRMPRALFPGKPKDFGSFALALQYFPEAFYLDEGVPSFGIGSLYADFGVFILLILAVAGFLGGLLTKTIVARIKLYRSPVDFILLCFFCGAVIIPIGAGYLLPEHVIMAVLLYLVARQRKRSSEHM